MKCTNKECNNGKVEKTLPNTLSYFYESCLICNGTSEMPEPITLGENGQRIVASLKEHQEDLQQIVDSKADTLLGAFTRMGKIMGAELQNVTMEPASVIPTADGFYWAYLGADLAPRICSLTDGCFAWYVSGIQKWCYIDKISEHFTSIHPTPITPPTDGWVKI